LVVGRAELRAAAPDWADVVAWAAEHRRRAQPDQAVKLSRRDRRALDTSAAAAARGVDSAAGQR
jgi:hypothetical protein